MVSKGVKYERYKSRDGRRREKERILIVCQGKQTEPNYFKSFRLVTADIRIDSKNRDPKKLVERADKLANKSEQEGDKYDQVWVVFDKDDSRVLNFNEAIKLAKSKKIRIAYSNQAFELWYLLHFIFYNVATSRKDYNKKLENFLKAPYKKNSLNMYTLLLNKQNKAIKHAERLLKKYPSKNPAKHDPSTTVHLLVKELNKFK